MNSRVTVCVCGQTPPPVHGQAVMFQALLEGTYARLRLIPVRMAFSSHLGEVGKPGLRKLILLFGLALRLALARLRGATVLYYPPAGPGRVPLWRDILLLSLARRLFPKTVYHFHALGLAEQYAALSPSGRALFRWAYGSPDLVIYLSAHGPADAAPMRPRASRIIPNGIAERPGLPLPDRSARPPGRPPVILFMGSLTAEKGLPVLLETFRLLRARGIPFQAVLAGHARSPAHEQETRAALAALGLAASVRLPGLLTGSAKWEAFAEADLFFFPSQTDSFGLVALEAMMMELPVVASDWCGLKDLVADGVTGFRAPRGEAPAFADKLERLLGDPALRRQMGRAGRALFLQDYTLDLWRARMEAALADVGGSP